MKIISNTPRKTFVSEEQAKAILGDSFWGTQEVISIFGEKIIKRMFGGIMPLIPTLTITEEDLFHLRNNNFGIMLCAQGNIALAHLQAPIKEKANTMFSFLEKKDEELERRRSRLAEYGGVAFCLQEEKELAIRKCFPDYNESYMFAWKIVSLFPLENTENKSLIFKIKPLIEVFQSVIGDKERNFGYSKRIGKYKDWLASLHGQLPMAISEIMNHWKMEVYPVIEQLRNNEPWNLGWVKIMKENQDLTEIERAVDGLLREIPNLEDLNINNGWRFRKEGDPPYVPYKWDHLLMEEISQFEIAKMLTPTPNEMAYQYLLKLFTVNSEKQLKELAEQYRSLKTFHQITDASIVCTFPSASEEYIYFYNAMPTEGLGKVFMSFNVGVFSEFG